MDDSVEFDTTPCRVAFFLGQRSPRPGELLGRRRVASRVAAQRLTDPLDLAGAYEGPAKQFRDRSIELDGPHVTPGAVAEFIALQRAPGFSKARMRLWTGWSPGNRPAIGSSRGAGYPSR
jgi:hypothetical protein